MCPYIPFGMTAAARRLRSRSSARIFSWLAMSDIVARPPCSDELACDRLDARCIQPVVGVEGGGRADEHVLVGNAVSAERDAGARFDERLRHRGTQPAGEVVLLNGENGA